MTRITLFISIFLSTIVLVSTFVFSGYMVTALLSLMVGATWFFVEWNRIDKLSFTCFICNSSFSVMQILCGFLPIPMILVIVFSISAFDLSRFQHRIYLAGYNDSHKIIEFKHLKRLALSNIVGFSLSLIAITINLNSGFYVLIGTGIVLFLIVCKLVSRLSAD